MMFDNGLEKIWRVVTSDEGSEKIVEAFVGCNKKVLDKNTVAVEAYPSIFEIWESRFRIGLASR
jgi:uncharacterized protein Veg